MVAQGPDRGLTEPFSGGRCALRFYRRRARYPARDANLDDGTVRTACNSSPRRHATPVRRRDANGEHACLAPACHADRQSDATLRCFLTGRSLSRRRLLDRLAVACRDGRDRQRLFCLLVAPFPPRDLWRLSVTANTSDQQALVRLRRSIASSAARME